MTKLRSVLKTLDDDALAALANRGLLRRAKKDLEAAKPNVTDVEDGLVRVTVGDDVVELPENPAGAKCTCPATGVCRHVLAAMLYIRDDPEVGVAQPSAPPGSDAVADPSQPIDQPDDGPLPSPAAVLGDLDDRALQKWAGKPLLRKALQFVAGEPQLDIDAGAALVVRFPERNVTCRWIPGGGLAGMICSCRAETVCEHLVAAVLAYQVSLGRRHIEPEHAALQESSGAPRSRAEVLASVAAVLGEAVSLGLSRLSLATVRRLTTLAVSAHGVDLPRLERMLKSLADETQLALRRDAQTSPARLLTLAGRIEALRLGLTKSQSTALVGQHRSRYSEVGQITLVGLGAQHWRSKGGYRGLTVYFWDQSRGGWATWSDSRPENQSGFSPACRFAGVGPWAGCGSPEEASRSVLRLTGAWRNTQGRISGRPGTRALVLGPARPREIPNAVADWSLLAERSERLFGGSLTAPTENLDLVLLLPDRWDPPRFDPVRQELRRTVVDAAGRGVDLWLPFTPEQEQAVGRLEAFEPGPGDGLLGAVRLVGGAVCVQPISLFAGDAIVSLNLERPRDQSPAKRTAQRATLPDAAGEDETLGTGEAGEADEDGFAQPTAAATPLGRILIVAQAELEAIAESGIAVRHDRELLAGAARRLDALGLTTCSRPMTRLIELLANSARLAEPTCRNEAAGMLLHCYYVLRLASDHETLATAGAGLRSAGV